MLADTDGAQGPDISTIPAIALRQIEVLRDGAAAQYGSDAIAGVLNFLLKDDSSGGSLELHTGGYGAGDGGAYTVAGNAGLPLGRTGFANLSVEYGNSAATSRSVQRDDAALLIAAGNEAVADPAQIWGSPRVEDNVKLWGNFGYLFAGGVQAYGHANYASRRVASGFFFRNPNTRAAVFSADRGQSLLIGDTLDAQDGVLNRSAGCPVVPVTAGRPDQAALGRVFADPNCSSFQERFAGGFTPQFGGDVLDTSLVAGLRGQLTGGVLWDASATAGTSEADFFIEDTVNASLGPATPTTFDPGLYRQDEIGLNVDLGYPLNDKDPPGRRRRVAGRALHDRPGRRAVVADRAVRPARLQRRVQRLPRLQPHSRRGLEPRQRRALRRRRGAGRGRRLDPGQRTPPGGLRGLRHDDERQALRLVPTHWRRRPARQREQRLPRADPRPAERLQRLDRVRPRADGPGQQRHHPLHLAGAALRGGEPLQPERAVSYALGAVVDAGPFSLTADYFRIRLADRLALTQLFALSPTEVEGLLTEGVTSARNLQNFRFFTNHFETRTQGLDLVATYRPPSLGGRTTFGFLFNRTATAVTGSDPTVLDALRVRELQEAIPGTRWNATVRHEIGPWRLLGRFSYYDEWFDSRDLYVYHGDSVFDLEAAYTVSESTTLTIGGQNVFGNDPEANPIARAKGNRFSVQTPFGANGGFYYVRINYGWTAGG